MFCILSLGSSLDVRIEKVAMVRPNTFFFSFFGSVMCRMLCHLWLSTVL
jgi:hypothetical protein